MTTNWHIVFDLLDLSMLCFLFLGELTEEEMLEQAIALSMQQGDT